MDDLIITKKRIDIYDHNLFRHSAITNYVLNDIKYIAFESRESIRIDNTGYNLYHVIDYQMNIDGHGFPITRKLFDEPFSIPPQLIEDMDETQHEIIKPYLQFILSHMEKDFFDMNIIIYGI